MKKRLGFTLVEILVVVVIISMIAGIAVVAYTTQQKIARDTNLAAGAMQLATAMDDYYAANGGYPVTCDIGTSTLLACSSLNSTYTSSMTKPPTITRTTTTATLRNILPRLGDVFRHPRSESATLINQQTGSAISKDSYFLLSMDMVPGADTVTLPPPGGGEEPCPPMTICNPGGGVTGSTGITLARSVRPQPSPIHVLAANTTPASDTVMFQNPTGGTLSCGFDLTGANPAAAEDIRPHQYVIGFVSEEKNAWRFFISPASSDQNVLNWNNAAEPRCNAVDTSELKQLSSS